MKLSCVIIHFSFSCTLLVLLKLCGALMFIGNSTSQITGSLSSTVTETKVFAQW